MEKASNLLKSCVCIIRTTFDLGFGGQLNNMPTATFQRRCFNNLLLNDLKLSSSHLNNLSHIRKQRLFSVTSRLLLSLRRENHRRSPLNLPITPKSFLHGFIAIVGGKHFLFVCIEKNGALRLFLHGYLTERRGIRKRETINNTPKERPQKE